MAKRPRDRRSWRQAITLQQIRVFILVLGAAYMYANTDFTPVETSIKNMPFHKAFDLAIGFGTWGAVIHFSKNADAVVKNYEAISDVEYWLVYLLARAPVFCLNLTVFVKLCYILGDVASAFFFTAFLFELLKIIVLVMNFGLLRKKLARLFNALIVVFLLRFMGLV